MKRLSDYHDEEALDFLADILEPCSEIFGDAKFGKLYQDGNPIKAIQYIIKEKRASVLDLLAKMNGVEVKDYHFTITSLINDLLEVLNDPELGLVFPSQSQRMPATAFGSATENTTEKKT